MKIKLGIDNFFSNYKQNCYKKKIGLVANQASINSNLVHSFFLLKRNNSWDFKMLFVPEHGLFGMKEYMESIESYYDEKLDIEIVSLYGEDLEKIAKKFEEIDVLIFDLQDIGIRYYTYVSTLAFCIEICSELNIPLYVCDRPNPLSGSVIQGNILEENFRSYVGKFPLPVRHGLTIGEIALYIKDYLKLKTEVKVISMKNWHRKMYWNNTGLYWIQSSPNIPTWQTAIFYSGTCLFEGTNISEGRGTTKPFEIFGAPWINPYQSAEVFNSWNLPFIKFLPIYFIPKFDKYAHQVCGGLQIVILDPKADAYIAVLKIIDYLYKAYPNYFKWRQPPYEFSKEHLPFDLLTGTDKIRKIIEDNEDLNLFLKKEYKKLKNFSSQINKYLLYK